MMGKTATTRKTRRKTTETKSLVLKTLKIETRPTRLSICIGKSPGMSKAPLGLDRDQDHTMVDEEV